MATAPRFKATAVTHSEYSSGECEEIPRDFGSVGLAVNSDDVCSKEVSIVLYWYQKKWLS